MGHAVRFSTATLSCFAGEAAGAVSPAKVGADPAKMALLGRDGMDLGTAGAVMVGEIAFEVVVLVPMALVAAAVFPGGGAGTVGALAYAVAVTAVVLGLLGVARLPLRAAPAWWTRLGLTGRRWRLLRVLARRFRHRSRALLHLRRDIIVLVLVATIIHIVGRLAILPALAGQNAPADFDALIVWPFLLLYGGAMIPTPGGGGMIEAGFAATLTGVLAPEILAGLLVWWRAYTFYLPAVIGGVVLLLGGFVMKR